MKQTRETMQRAEKATRDHATFNGAYLRDSLDTPDVGDDPVAIATARTVSVLIQLRQLAQQRLLSVGLVQAAIDGFMGGAQVEEYQTGMGGEAYRRVTD